MRRVEYQPGVKETWKERDSLYTHPLVDTHIPIEQHKVEEEEDLGILRASLQHWGEEQHFTTCKLVDVLPHAVFHAPKILVGNDLHGDNLCTKNTRSFRELPEEEGRPFGEDQEVEAR